MKLKLAKKSLSEKKLKTIDIKTIEKELEQNPSKVFYFDNENDHKNLVSLVDHFTDKGLSVHLKEVKFSLSENEYIYEFWVL
jgi:hypothetical protein